MYLFKIHKILWCNCLPYVDDMLIFGTNMKGVCETKNVSNFNV